MIVPHGELLSVLVDRLELDFVFFESHEALDSSIRVVVLSDLDLDFSVQVSVCFSDDSFSVSDVAAAVSSWRPTIFATGQLKGSTYSSKPLFSNVPRKAPQNSPLKEA